MPSREEEVAWAAGLFEGEGCITQVGRQFTLAVVNTDEEVIGRFDEIVSLGQIYGPYSYELKDGFRRKPVFRWIATEYNALDAMQLLAPWLSKRRIDRAFELTGRVFPAKDLPI
jgi:hypothetical protein